MKYFKLVLISAAVLSLISCTKHKILFDTTKIDPATQVEFQLHYFEPIVNSAAYYIDSVFVNGVLYSSVNGSGQLLPYNGVPGGAVGRFFAVKAGDVKFTFYRKGNVVYDWTVNLQPGKCNIFVHDLTKAPVVLDNLEDQYRATVSSGNNIYGTDSVATVRFYNFMYEDANTPYPGKLQYQWKRTDMADYENLGAPVAFGEATDRVPVIVRKTYFNSSGYCIIYYRILDENGDVLMKWNGSRFAEYSDWWYAYIGRSYNHIMRGIRTASPTTDVSLWTSL